MDLMFLDWTQKVAWNRTTAQRTTRQVNSGQVTWIGMGSKFTVSAYPINLSKMVCVVLDM